MEEASWHRETSERPDSHGTFPSCSRCEICYVLKAVGVLHCIRVYSTFTWRKRFVPNRLSIVAHDAGDGVSASGYVTTVTVVWDLWPQLVVITCPTGIHDGPGVKAGLSWFFCGEQRDLVLVDLFGSINLCSYQKRVNRYKFIGAQN